MKRSSIPVFLIALAGVVAYPAFVSGTGSALADPWNWDCDATKPDPFEEPFCCECVSPPDPEIEIFLCEQVDRWADNKCRQDPSFICWESFEWCSLDPIE